MICEAMVRGPPVLVSSTMRSWPLPVVRLPPVIVLATAAVDRIMPLLMVSVSAAPMVMVPAPVAVVLRRELSARPPAVTVPEKPAVPLAVMFCPASQELATLWAV